MEGTELGRPYQLPPQGAGVAAPPRAAPQPPGAPPALPDALALLEHVEDAIVVLDRRWRYTYLNRVASWILGQPREALLGRVPWELWPDLEGSTFQRACLAAVRGESSVLEEYYPALERWIETRVFPAPEGVTAFFRDVTRRKRAEEQVASALSRLTATLDSTADAILVVDRGGQVVDCNRRFLEFFLPAGTEVKGLPASALAERWAGLLEDQEDVFRRLGPVMRDPEAECNELLPLRDGRVVEAYSIPQRLDREIVGRVWSFRDVTASHRLARELGERERHFRKLIEHGSDVVTLMDAEGRTIYVGPSIERVLGWTPQELVGRAVRDFLHPDDLAAFDAALAEVRCQPGRAVPLVVRYRHKEGGWRYLESTRSNLLEDPTVGGIVVNARDVTERLQLEEDLRQLQKMDAMGRLAGGVAHDFNNLLTVIGGSAELLSGMLAPGDPRAEETEAIRRAVDRAASLTRQLLAFSRRQTVAPTAFSLSEAVARSQKMLRRLIGEHIEVELDLACEDTSIVADVAQIEQVLLNLAINARDAMPQGGRLTLRTRGVGAAPDGLGGRVLLSVSDTGAGMDEATRARIFEPFFTTKPKDRGTGLGLATVYGIVRQAGGAIAVESEPGAGTTIELSFPRALVAMAPAPDDGGEAPPPPAGGSETVLLVEDDPRVRLVGRRALADRGYRVLEAGSAPEALEVAAAHPGELSLVISDVVLPGPGGPELAAALRGSRPGVPFLFVTGYCAEELERCGLDASSTPVLEKPFTAAQLANKVRALLDH